MNKPDHVTVLREGAPNKDKENALREACKALRDANIPYDIVSTPSGYQDADSFETCMMHLLRAIRTSEVALGFLRFKVRMEILKIPRGKKFLRFLASMNMYI